MNKRELQLFAALTNIGDDLIEESFAFLPAGGGAADGATVGTPKRAGKRPVWFLPAVIAACAAFVASAGIAVAVLGNSFQLFPFGPSDTTDEGATQAPDSAEEYEVAFVIDGYPFEQPAKQVVKAGRCAVAPALDLPDDGSRFDGWYTSEDRSADTRFDFSTPITANLTLYAAMIPIGTVEDEWTDEPVDDGVTLPETPDAGMAYQDKIIFVGDSLTARLINRGGLTGGKNTKQVWRTESNMMNLNSEITAAQIIYPETGEKMTVAEAAALAKPEIMVITLGTDWGVSYLTETEFKACYASLVQAIQAASPDTRIILQSIFPVTEDCAALNNDRIDTANGWVKDIATENGCRYLDTQSVLKDGEGCLKKEYGASADGIHLSDDAYAAILAYIRTHALLS